MSKGLYTKPKIVKPVGGKGISPPKVPRPKFAGPAVKLPTGLKESSNPMTKSQKPPSPTKTLKGF